MEDLVANKIGSDCLDFFFHLQIVLICIVVTKLSLTQNSTNLLNCECLFNKQLVRKPISTDNYLFI